MPRYPDCSHAVVCLLLVRPKDQSDEQELADQFRQQFGTFSARLVSNRKRICYCFCLSLRFRFYLLSYNVSSDDNQTSALFLVIVTLLKSHFQSSFFSLPISSFTSLWDCWRYTSDLLCWFPIWLFVCSFLPLTHICLSLCLNVCRPLSPRRAYSMRAP